MSILATHGHVVSALVVVMVAPWAVWLLCEMAGYQEPAYTSPAPVVAVAVELDVLAQVERLLETMELEP